MKKLFKLIMTCVGVLFSVLGLSQNKYLKFETSTGSIYNSNSGVSTYYYPKGVSLSGNMQNQLLPISIRPQGIFLNTFSPSAVSQSSTDVYETNGGTNYLATLEDLYDLNYTTGARTTGNGGLQTITIDLGQSTTFSDIQLAAITAANLNGATLQTSPDGTTWTTVVSNANGLPLTSISGATNTSLTLFSFASVTARYVRLTKYDSKLDLSEFRLLPSVSQSSGTVLGTPINLYDNVVSAAATTLATSAGQWIMQDLGCNRNFSAVKLCAVTVANLNGAELQVSTNGSTWTTLTTTNSATGVSGATIAGISATYPITFNFPLQNARYIRVYKSTASIVETSEFQVAPEVRTSSATTLALSGNKTTLNDGSFITGITTAATAGITQWAVINLGKPVTFSHVQLATITSVANLDGSSIQTSNDAINWTTQVASITGSSTTQLVPYYFSTPVTAQYVRVLKGTAASTLAISEFIVSPAITLSSGTKPVATNFGNLYDNAIAATTTTGTGTNQYVMLDFGSNKNFSHVQIAAGTAVGNLDGAELQISTDAINWTNLTFTNDATGVTGTTFSGSSIVYPITYTFTNQNARYIRVFRSGSGIVSLGEFRVAPAIFQSSATSLANNAIATQFSEGTYTTGALSTTVVGVNQYSGINFGSPKTFNTIVLAPLTATTNLDGSTFQVSNDGYSWTTVPTLTNTTTEISNSTVEGSVLNTLRTYTFSAQTAQYARLIKLDGSAIGISEFRVGSVVSQSSGTSLGTPINLSNNSTAAAAVTSSGTNQWVMIDLGTSQTINMVQLATSGAVANLDGATLQVSTDAITWTTLTVKNNRTGTTAATITGSSTTYPDIFSFSNTTARFIRVFRAATGIVAVSEFKISPDVYQSSGTNYASSTKFYDGIYNVIGAQTATGTGSNPAYIGLNLGSSKTFSQIEIATTSIANLNGAVIESSNDFLTWTTLVPSISGMVASQLNTFTFSSTSARYIRVRSNSIALIVSEFKIGVGTNSSKKLINPAVTNTVSAIENIGFTFNFKGTDYTTYSVNSNGLLRLGNTVVTNEYVNNIVSPTNTPTLFAYWDYIATGNAATNGGVTRTITGSAPNRKLIVEWRNSISNAVGNTALVFQIALHEGTNKIEYLYDQGINNTTNASIGMAIGTTAQTKEFYSVTPNATLSNTTYSNMSPNDFVTLWPGSGSIYSFTPTDLPLTAAILTDFKTLDNAMGAANWASTPNAGGYTVTIPGNYTETAPMGYPTVPAGTTYAKYSGFLLTASGTSADPIKFKWNNSGAKPVFTAATGVSLNDYIIGIAGSDYTTFEGLSLIENPNNATTPNNNKWTELGIVFFKKQKGTTSLGANGSQHNIVKNCNITLDRRQNGTINVSSNGYIQVLPLYTKGIAMVYWDALLNGANTTENINADCNSTGIISSNDVNSYNEFYSNTINECYYGFWANDRYKGTTIAGTGNIFGKVSEGNTITNFGAYLGIVYTGGTVTWATHSIKVPKAIFFGALKDASIEGNSISNGYASHYRVIGIEFGTFERGNNGLKNIGKVMINNNNITNLYGNTAAPATNASDAIGIMYAPGTVWARKQIALDNLSISNNTINGLYTKLGKAYGITTGPVYNDAGYDTVNYFSVIDGNGMTATIDGNTITNLNSTGITTSAVEGVVGIYWGANYSTTSINTNNINTLELGDGTTNPAAGSKLSGIVFNTNNSAATRASVSVNSNIISNNIARSNTGTATQILCRMLQITKGGTMTDINNNTIENNDFTYAKDNSYQNPSNHSSIIEVQALPSSGTSTLNIKDNVLNNNIRRGMRGGSYSYLNGIYAINTTNAQNQFIENNHINGLELLLASGATPSTYAVVSGIRVKGKITNVTTTINNNTITGIKGDKLKTALTVANAHTGVDYNIFSMRGITVEAVKRADVTKNLIYNNSTLTSLGYINTSTTASTYLDGNLGIGVIGSTSTTYQKNIYAINNNFIYDLYAPSMNAPSAITGIFINKYGDFYVDHNTVTLGDPVTSTPVTSNVTSAGIFGASGILYAPYSISNGTRNQSSAYEKYTFRNNIIAIESTNKGTGASIAMRQVLVGTAKKYPGDMTSKTNGNSYYVNPGTWNYLYGQGTIANTTGGLRNCFAISAATANTTQNLIVNTDFNLPCSEYEKYMAGAEYTTTSDLNAGLNQSIPQPFVGGTSNPGKRYITTGSTSYVFSPIKATTGAVTINDDYVTVGSRPATNATAGAYQTTGNAQYSKTLSIVFDDVKNTICMSNVSLTATIIKNVSTVSVGTGSDAPRLYYKLSTNTNQVPNATQNNSSFNGWKWVNPSTISGDDYTFVFDFSLLNGTLTPPLTIEYFIIATDDGSYNSTQYYVVTGTTLPYCINNVDLYTSGGNSNTLHTPELDGGSPATLTASNNFQILAPNELNKYTYNSTDETRTTANTNNATAKIICPNTTVKIKSFFNYVSTGEKYEHQEGYIFQSSASNTFSPLLSSVAISDPEYDYTIGSHTSNVYIRIVPACSGSAATGYESPYIYLTTIGCPTVTSDITTQRICVQKNSTVPITNDNIASAGTRYYFIQDAIGKAYYSAGTTSSVSGNVTVNPNAIAATGTWNASVGLLKNTISTGGYLHASLAADVDNQSTSLMEQTGMNFTTTEYTKLNSVILYDDTNDASTTTGFKLVLYHAGTQTKLYETGTLTVANGGTLTVTFTNWYIGSGNFNLVIESIDPDNPMTGLLLSPSSIATPNTVNYEDFPFSIGNTLIVNGGIDNNDTSTLSNTYNYFLNWNVTTYCTDKPGDDFNVNALECVDCILINPRLTKKIEE